MDNGDVISKLPRDLLISILSRLTLEEAMLTSVLSRHWEKLWTFYHGDLDFEVSTKLQQKGCSNYVRLVNKVMDTLEPVQSGGMLDSITICCRLCPENFTSFDRWVHFALEKRGVKRLILENYFYPRGCSHSILAYDFPPLRCFNSQQRSNLRALTSIRFQRVNVSGESIEHFLYNCPLLQSLDLIESCESLIHLRISGKALALRHLLICDCHDLTTVELSAPNLVSFTYKSEGITEVKFDVGNVPKLVKFTIGISSSCPHVTALARHLLTSFPHLEKLKLEISCWEPGVLTKLTALTAVKHLTMKFAQNCSESIVAWTPVLKAFPVLQKLTLNMHMRRECRIDGMTVWHETFPNNKHLKEVEFVGFGKSKDDIELVMHLLKKTGTLEKIILHCSGRMIVGSVDINDVEKALRFAAELKQIIPDKVDLVILQPPRSICNVLFYDLEPSPKPSPLLPQDSFYV